MCYKGKIPPLELGNMHIACLYGDNGNGKSAIIDAITWVLWGKSRARSDDDLIHLGEERMEVELTFIQGKNRYKVRRGRIKSKRGQTYLELQIQKGDRFIGVGGSTIAETQKAICDLLRMDYDTFVDVMHDKEENDYTYAKWKMMQKCFQKWFCDLDNGNASKFCDWVLYSEDE